MAGNRSRLVAVANEKGGVGKTAMVINLGAALSRMGRSVLIVDMDPQQNATYGLGIAADEDKVNIYDLLADPDSHAAVDAVRPTKWKGLDLIPSHIDLAGAEVELVEEEGRENRLKNALSELVGRYDVILMDTPPSLSLLTINVFAFSAEVLVPCQTQPYAFRALEDLFDTIEAVREDINPEIRVTGIVPTFFDQRTRVSNMILERLKSDERYQHLVYETCIRSNTTIADSSEAGKPVVFYRTGSYGAHDFNALAEEFLQSR